MPQGGSLSLILSNIYLDKELEEKELRFVRCTEDSNIFVKSKMIANRGMKSVTSWLESKLFLKVCAITKVIRSINSHFLGCTYFKTTFRRECGPPTKAKRNFTISAEKTDS